MNHPVAIVTAASRGIGAACARKLAREGYRLVLMSRSEDIKNLAAELNAIFVIGSVNNRDDLQILANTALDNFQRVDAVIANTGHPAKGELLALSDDDWHEALDLLLLNVIRLSRHVVPVMQQQGGGAFINISTLGAEEPSLLFPISSTLRAGLSAFVKLFAQHYAADNIRMNNVLPGFVDNYEVSEAIRKQIPMKRAATVDEIADTVSFLAGPQSGYITGQNIRVDGGLGKSI